MKTLPVYKLRIKSDDADSLEMNAIALVDEPAIMIDFLKFNKQEKFTAHPEKQLITAPALIANMPIYRNDKKYGEHYVIFDKETIYEMVQKFFRKGNTSKFNLMHNSGDKTEGIYIIESMLIDSERDIVAPKAFSEVSQGSWVISAKVDNPKIWQDIKEGKYKGFSIEGFFEHESQPETDEALLEQISEIVRGL